MPWALPGSAPSVQGELRSPGGSWQLPPAGPSATAGTQGLGQSRIRAPQHGHGSARPDPWLREPQPALEVGPWPGGAGAGSAQPCVAGGEVKAG